MAMPKEGRGHQELSIQVKVNSHPQRQQLPIDSHGEKVYGIGIPQAPWNTITGLNDSRKPDTDQIPLQLSYRPMPSSQLNPVASHRGHGIEGSEAPRAMVVEAWLAAQDRLRSGPKDYGICDDLLLNITDDHQTKECLLPAAGQCPSEEHVLMFVGSQFVDGQDDGRSGTKSGSGVLLNVDTELMH